MIRAALFLAVVCVASTGMAQDLRLPVGATVTLQTTATADTLAIATGGWNGALPQKVASGTVTRSAWKLVDAAQTPLAVLQPLRDQLVAQGFVEIYSCPEVLCGGYNFRFALDVLRPPAMQVNLADYQYWAGQRDDDYSVILASRIADTVYVQIDRIGEKAAPTLRPNSPRRPVPTGEAATLEVNGRMVLTDLTFAPGSSSLAEGSYASLATLAVYLNDNPSLKVALVGHTDTSGSLEANIALSKRRAQSVMARLIDSYNVPRSQLAAEGMGYLSPLASNLSESGREANRRVEVIVIGRSD